MPKATIIIDVNVPDEVALFERWLEHWSTSIELSDNRGCGCCVNIWDVVAPQAALNELPSELISMHA